MLAALVKLMSMMILKSLDCINKVPKIPANTILARESVILNLNGDPTIDSLTVKPNTSTFRYAASRSGTGPQ